MRGWAQQMVNSYSKMRQGGLDLQDHFKVREFACKDNTDALLIDSTLVCILELVRRHFGVPVDINSAYRTKTWNKKQGGAENSQHLYGKAADIVVRGISPYKVYNYLNAVMPNWGGLILYETKRFVHVDTRDKKYREVRK